MENPVNVGDVPNYTHIIIATGDWRASMARFKQFVGGRSIRAMNLLIFTIAIGFSFWKFGVGVEPHNLAILKITIVDAESQRPTPARVEVFDDEGKTYVAADALLVGGDAIDRPAPWQGSIADALGELSREVRNTLTGTEQFYSSGTSQLSLAPGTYKVTVSKGYEYELRSDEITLSADETREMKIELTRWIRIKEQGWYSSDDHIHVSRPHEELNPYLSKWMQAEDIHVANLLQYGNIRGFNNTIQYSHGNAGVYREGNYLVVSGQENPRTHFLGHTIILGESAPINFPEQYLVYRFFWEEARRQGALSGYAHAGLFAGASNGLAIDLPLDLLSFMEVLQFDGGYFDVWYNVLNTGFSMAPTAGTDYPVSPTLPGMERFYTRVEGPLTLESWLEGIRLGRTIVSNGAFLEFRVNAAGIGEELVLDRPGTVRVEGCVRFNPVRDEIEKLEVIQNGSILQTFERKGNATEIRADFETEVSDAGWLALRASGKKVRFPRPRFSLAHTGPIYLSVKNAPTRSEHPRAKALARTWATRLRELHGRLHYQRSFLGRSRFNEYVPEDLLDKGRPALVEAIGKAREYFEAQAR